MADEGRQEVSDVDPRFLFLTNNSAPTPKELSQKMKRLGIDIPEEHFYTSAIATAKFLESQSTVKLPQSRRVDHAMSLVNLV
jgi:ribonucleotide monophosphatase NagD (HAD superfamily)